MGLEEKLKRLTEEKEVLKSMVILLAQAYQHNYDKFADSYNYSKEIQSFLSEEELRVSRNIAMSFASINGSLMRGLIQELSTLNAKKESFNLTLLRSLFDYNTDEARKSFYEKKFSESSKKSKVDFIKSYFQS